MRSHEVSTFHGALKGKRCIHMNMSLAVIQSQVNLVHTSYPSSLTTVLNRFRVSV
jgi:hypothetical protein